MKNNIIWYYEIPKSACSFTEPKVHTDVLFRSTILVITSFSKSQTTNQFGNCVLLRSSYFQVRVHKISKSHVRSYTVLMLKKHCYCVINNYRAQFLVLSSRELSIKTRLCLIKIALRGRLRNTTTPSYSTGNTHVQR